MAIWRHREMENALGGVIDSSMTVDQLQRLVDEFSSEHEFVDFKAKGALMPERAARKEWRFECGKDVSAFANGRGGLMIYGVRDAKAVAAGSERPVPFAAGEADPDELEEIFRRAVREVTAPVPGFEMFPVYDGDSFYMVCVIPPSVLAPHAATMPGDGREGLVYPKRAAGESQAVYMREYHVAEIYERRARVGEERRRRAETVWGEGVAALDAPRAPRVWLAVASTPDLPQDDVLTEEVRRAIDEWDDREPFPRLIHKRFVGVGGYPVPAPGRVCLTEIVQGDPGERAFVSEVRNFYREIHADGSAFAALPLTAPDALSPFSLSVDALVDSVATAAANAMAWTGTRTGMWGATTVTAGIVVNGPEPAALEATDFGSHDFTRKIYRRLEGRWPRAVTVVDLADTVTMQQRLRVAFRLATPLVQAFGAPRLDWLDEDGSLRTFYMLSEHRQAIAEWAQHYRVPINPSS
ncbi:helix-turn-helix domain-containing protein [Mycobacterium sp. TJFP1]